MRETAGNGRPLLLALVLAAGAGGGWLLLCIVIQSLASSSAEFHWTIEELLVLQDGTPVIAKRSQVEHGVQLRTLDGELRSAAGLLRPAYLPSSVRRGDLGPRNWDMRVRTATDFRTPPSLWYFVHDGRRQGHGWFEGYDRTTKQRIGQIGREGFRTDQLQRHELFPIDGRAFGPDSVLIGHVGDIVSMPWWWTSIGVDDQGTVFAPWQVFLISDGQLLEIDLRMRRVRTLLEDHRLIAAGVVNQVSADDESAVPSGTLRQYLAARGDDVVWIVDPAQGTSREFPLPDELRERALDVYRLQDGLLLAASAPVELVWLDEQGALVKRQRAPGSAEGGEGEWENRFAVLIMLPAPAVLGAILLALQPWEALAMGHATASDVLAAAVQEHGSFALAIMLLASALAAWCYRRHRRYGQPGGWQWFLFVLLLGLPGLAGYLLHRRWPLRRACDGCGRLAPHDRSACHSCGAPFPRPRATGTEVFARAAGQHCCASRAG